MSMDNIRTSISQKDTLFKVYRRGTKLNKRLFDESDIVIEDGRVVIDITGYEVSRRIKAQLTQLSWRPQALIETNERLANECKNHTQPQNFKVYDMLLAQAEEIRVLLRQCGIEEPKTTLHSKCSGGKK